MSLWKEMDELYKEYNRYKKMYLETPFHSEYNERKMEEIRDKILIKKRHADFITEMLYGKKKPWKK